MEHLNLFTDALVEGIVAKQLKARKRVEQIRLSVPMPKQGMHSSQHDYEITLNLWHDCWRDAFLNDIELKILNKQIATMLDNLYLYITTVLSLRKFKEQKDYALSLYDHLLKTLSDNG